VLDAMEADLGVAVPDVSVDGGATCNALLMQMLADLTGRTVLRPATIEASALGAARMAADALGFPAWPDGTRDRFCPSMPAAEAQAIRAGWHDAIARASA
jgi:glycerol kinase